MSIQQKVSLTLFEAREKVLEIEVMTNEEFAIQKQKKLEQDIDSIDSYFKSKEKQVSTDKKM
jgi:vacuolar-type H+-ATPase subunit E/Vma4